MVIVTIKILAYLFTLIVVGALMYHTGKYINMLPESNKYKGILAIDEVVLLVVLIRIIVMIVRLKA